MCIQPNEFSLIRRRVLVISPHVHRYRVVASFTDASSVVDARAVMDADEQTIAQTEALAEFLTQYAQDGGDLDPENAPEEMREILSTIQATLGGDALEILTKAAKGALRDPSARLNKALTRSAHATDDATTVEITPVPSFTVKTRDASGGKVFVNVCAHDALDVPERGSEQWREGLMPKDVIRALESSSSSNSTAAIDDTRAELRFPLSCADARKDVDASGIEAVVFDCVFNTAIVRHASAFKPLKRYLVELVLNHISAKFALALDPEYRLPQRTFIGARPPPPQKIRVGVPMKLVSPIVQEREAKKAPEKFDECMQYDVEFVNRPVTRVKVRVKVPRRARHGVTPRDVVVSIVREGITLDCKGCASERIDLPFLVEAQSARAKVLDDTTLLVTADYLPYDVAVERCIQSN